LSRLQIHSFISKFGHKNICTLLEAIETNQHYFIFLEYIPDGDLVDYIEATARVPDAEARILFRQVMEAIQFLHGHSIIHRDIKAENFLVVKRIDPPPLSNGATSPATVAGDKAQVNGVDSDVGGEPQKPPLPPPPNAPLLKLTDFGLADWIQNTKSFNTPCGSPVYTGS